MCPANPATLSYIALAVIDLTQGSPGGGGGSRSHSKYWGMYHQLIVLPLPLLYASHASQSLLCMQQGAAEIVLRSCTKVVSAEGSTIPLTSSMRAELEEVTTDMASRGLRTLCMTYRDFPANVERPADFFETPPDSELICCAITGIKAS